MKFSLSRRAFALFTAFVLAASMCGFPVGAFAETPAEGQAGTETASSPIVIVHTNDVHCNIDQALGYAKLSSYVDAMEAQYGADQVTLVDAGDAVQGNVIGTLSQGEYLVKLMNQVGYDIAIPGNHEFDYGMTQFKTLVALANAKYVSCNFMDLRTGETVLDPYQIVEYGTGESAVKVAYVGISTPSTITSSSPSSFQDESGNYIYGFCQDDSGQLLATTVQASVDAARAEGADYVIAVAHLGQNGSKSQWRSDLLVQRTTGIDALIDGHSHEAYVQNTVRNANGEAIPVIQTGYGLQNIGTITIDPATGDVSAELVSEWDGIDEETAAAVADVNARVAATANQVIGTSEVDLAALEADNYTWAVRQRETNLGDFVADAYLAYARSLGLSADIAFINGGGLRANVAAGEVTYGNLINVNPYSNQLIMVTATGQQIRDALEVGVRNLPETSGGFLQVAGVSYKVRTDIASSVSVNADGVFQGVAGEYRVHDVTVNGEPLDLERTYNLVSISYLLEEGGNAMNMFQGLEATYVGLDSQALISYIQNDLNGTIGQEYANNAGQGRIALVDGESGDAYRYDDVQDESAWYFASVYDARDAGYMFGYEGTDLFDPDGTMTRGQAACVLARIAGEGEAADFVAYYPDVTADDYFAAAVTWAREAGVMTGYDDGSGLFGPNDPITREQMAVALHRLSEFQEGGAAVLAASIDSYEDEDLVSDWARESVAWAVECDILGGDSLLRPLDATLRSEAAKMAVQFAVG